MSFLVICKMFGLFVNTFTAHVKYCLLNRDSLMETIQIDLPKTRFILQDISTRDMVNRPKKCWNLRGSTFTKSIYYCEGN